jgi:hypothetical protein
VGIGINISTAIGGLGVGVSGDAISPTCVISSASAAIVEAPFSVTFTFSEDVTGFVAGSFSTTNGTSGSFVAVSGSVYTATITPTAPGAVTVVVPPGMCTDAAGNPNLASNVLSREYAMLAFTCTTTAPGQTLTLQRITPTGANVTVDWGDTTTSTILNGNTGTTTHIYAAAGTYDVRITRPSIFTYVDLRDAKISNFDTADLSRSVLTGFRSTNISGRFASDDMAGWTPTDWYCYTLPAGSTVNIDTSDMAGWTPTDWRCFSLPAGSTVNIDTSDMVGWTPTTWYCHSLPAGSTVNIDTSDMVGWTPTNWYCYSLPAGSTINIDTSDMVGWTPTNWYCYVLPAASTTWTVAAANLAGWISSSTISFRDNNLSQPNVDAFLNGFYQAFASRIASGGTIDAGGSGGTANAAPSGLLQAKCAPVDGKEFAYELVNDSCLVNPTKKWTTVNITA